MPSACELATHQSGIPVADSSFWTQGCFISYLLWTCGQSLMLHGNACLDTVNCRRAFVPDLSNIWLKPWSMRSSHGVKLQSVMSIWRSVQAILFSPFGPWQMQISRVCHRSLSTKTKKDSSVLAVWPFTNRPLWCCGLLWFSFFFRFHNVEDTNNVDIVSFLEDSWYNLTKFKMNTKKVKASLSRPCFNIQKRPR